jgi:hypothetical protein
MDSVGDALDVDQRLRRSLHARSGLLSGELPESPGNEMFAKLLQRIETRRSKKRMAILTAAGSCVVVLMVAGIVAASTGLLGVTRHTYHASSASMAAPSKRSVEAPYSAGEFAGRLASTSHPECAAGALDGKVLAGCTGTVKTYLAYSASAPFNGAASNASAGHLSTAGQPLQSMNSTNSAESKVPACSAPSIRRMEAHQPGSPAAGSAGSKAAVTLNPGDYLEVALVPSTASSRWMPEPPVLGRIPAGSSQSSHSRPSALSLCTLESPVAGALVLVARAVDPGTETITAAELEPATTCTGTQQNGTAPGATGRACGSNNATKASTKASTGNQATGTTGYKVAIYTLKVVVSAPAHAG